MATILIVEDVEDNRELARELLELAGHEVVSARNGMEALTLLVGCRPDLVLLDLSMPVVDGWETLARIREHPRWRTIKVLALTAHAMSGDRERVLEGGFDGYLAKPISVQEFATEVGTHL